MKRFATLFVAAVMLPACGVVFVSSFDGTNLLREMELNGDMVAGSEIVAVVEVNQTYPIPVRIACYYEEPDTLTDEEKRVAFHERAQLVGEQVLEPVADAEPGDDVKDIELSFPFSISEPGDYFIACITPASPDNGIGESFTVEAMDDSVA